MREFKVETGTAKGRQMVPATIVVAIAA